MTSVFSYFKQPTLLDFYLDKDMEIISTKKPQRLFAEVQSHPKRYTKMFNQNELETWNIFRKITMIHLLAFHYNQEVSILPSLRLNYLSNDQWLNKEIIKPYCNFLRKIINSQDFFEKVRTINAAYNQNLVLPDFRCKQKMRQNPSEYMNFELLFYCLNSLKELLKPLRKVTSLGRYYKQKSPVTLWNFCELATLQVCNLYFCFKFILNEMIRSYPKYISSPSETQFLSSILNQNLETINEQLKVLLLNKYFCAYEKGIKISLYDIYNQTKENKQNIQIILNKKIDQQDSELRLLRNRKFLNKAVFGDGFNVEAFKQGMQIMNTGAYEEQDIEDVIGQNSCLSLSVMLQRSQIVEPGQAKKSSNSTIQSTDTIQ